MVLPQRTQMYSSGTCVVWVRATFWSLMPSLAPQSTQSRTTGSRISDATPAIRPLARASERSTEKDSLNAW